MPSHSSVSDLYARATAVQWRDANSALQPAALTQWMEQACPWQDTRSSCFFYGQKTAAQAAALTEHISDDDMPARKLLRKLKGRRVVFAGDSVMIQFASAFMCRLRRFVRGDDFAWYRPTSKVEMLQVQDGSRTLCPSGTSTYCRLDVRTRHSCAEFGLVDGETLGTTVCLALFWRGGWRALLQTFNATRPDVLVFAVGYHATSSHGAIRLDHKHDWTAQADRDAFFSVAAAAGSLLVYHQHSFQHLPVTGHWDPRKTSIYKRSTVCSALPASYHDPISDFEEATIMPHMTGDRRVVLATGNLSRELWWAHTSDAPTPSDGIDCTHWCQPGLPDLWVGKLMRLLQGVGIS